MAFATLSGCAWSQCCSERFSPATVSRSRIARTRACVRFQYHPGVSFPIVSGEDETWIDFRSPSSCRDASFARLPAPAAQRHKRLRARRTIETVFAGNESPGRGRCEPWFRGRRIGNNEHDGNGEDGVLVFTHPGQHAIGPTPGKFPIQDEHVGDQLAKFRQALSRPPQAVSTSWPQLVNKLRVNTRRRRVGSRNEDRQLHGDASFRPLARSGRWNQHDSDERGPPCDLPGPFRGGSRSAVKQHSSS